MKTKKYAKVGKKPGRPSFRTPSVFKYQKSLKNRSNRPDKKNLEDKSSISYNVRKK